MNRLKACGFSLLEILIVLALCTTLLGIAVPSWQYWIKKQQANNAINQIYQILLFAQQAAITQQEAISICGSQSGSHCDNSWSSGLLIFKDSLGLGYPKNPQSILEFQKRYPDDSIIQWHGFGFKSFISFDTNGSTHGQNGTFSYCPRGSTWNQGDLILINHSGRIRLAEGKIRCL